MPKLHLSCRYLLTFSLFSPPTCACHFLAIRDMYPMQGLSLVRLIELKFLLQTLQGLQIAIPDKLRPNFCSVCVCMQVCMFPSSELFGFLELYFITKDKNIKMENDHHVRLMFWILVWISEMYTNVTFTLHASEVGCNMEHTLSQFSY